MAVNSKILPLTFNHVVLPPKLPGKRETEVQVLEVHNDLLSRVIDAVGQLKEISDAKAVVAWKSIEKTLRTLREVSTEGWVNEASLLGALKELQPGNAIILHVALQNACILIRYPPDEGENIIFETFETSATAESTLAAKGALEWDFPGSAVSLPLREFENPIFQNSLAGFLDRASCEVLDEFCPKIRKAGVKISETRDTVNPAIISQFLMPLLETNGSRTYPPILRKRVKDDVCWDNAELPWRRSPFWLVLRVCIQRLLCLYLGAELGRMQYKFLLCTLMARLLEDSVETIHHEECNFLKTKLCRRLAKLETERENASEVVSDAYTQLFSVIGPACQKSIDIVMGAFEARWQYFKKSTRRKIESLPQVAEDKDLRLSLPNSLPYLKAILNCSRQSRKVYKVIDPTILDKNSKKDTTEKFSAMTTRYTSLANMELAMGSVTHEIPNEKGKCEALCMEISRQIEGYMSAVGDAYENDPEQMGVFILCVFELWTQMDKCAIFVCPLLADYYPWLIPELLDRLQKVQDYIHERCTKAKEAENLQKLQETIETASTVARARKEAELVLINADHKDLTEKLAVTSCNQRRFPDGKHDIRDCSHCFHGRSHFLPSEVDLAHKRGVIFEDTTWRIVYSLCRKNFNSPSKRPEMLLGQYSQLTPYLKRRVGEKISLASHTKSFLGTHYKWKRLPAKEKNVLLPLALHFSYYDRERNVWLADFPKHWTCAHHFALRLPKSLSFATLYSTPAFAADASGPSSYKAIASIAECPSSLNVHEYVAHQNVMGGKSRRWLSILNELGSSNINFMLQAGPQLKNDSLRTIHCALRDPNFCRRLLEQIEQHLEIISSNWREYYYMETLLTLTIQLCELSCPELHKQAHDILLKIRGITLAWTAALRSEMRLAQEVDTVESAANHCLFSALLCRRTFALQAYGGQELDAESFKDFIEVTLTLQESLVIDVSEYKTFTRNIIVRDIKIAAALRPILRQAVTVYQTTLMSAIDTCWPCSELTSRQYTKWQFLSHPYEWWLMSMTQGTETSIPQVVHYHLLEGHLLVDGQTMGKLPADVRDSDVLKELFGNRRLVVYPSSMPGMSYVLATDQEGHRIHLGYRGKELVIRSEKSGRTLEFVPRQVFGKDGDMDLPSQLIDNCFHWLDLDSGNIEVRRQHRLWKESDWTISTRTRRVKRRNASLVDPHSFLFGLVAKIFRNFEQPHMLTIVQPLKGSLTVKLKRMNLTFYVNWKGLLQCKQLAAEIDPNQDAGTLYGLLSMLVLRRIHNRSQRVVIIPVGEPIYRRQGMHVHVKTTNTGEYATYSIDSILGQLRSPPESRLLYNKALLHALTSHFIADPLIGRTGTEEALSWLQSGCCQPWAPLTTASLKILRNISALTPRRVYYPKNQKSQQTISWDNQLTITIQHDAYMPVIDHIVKKSKRLESFELSAPSTTIETPDTVSHLRDRSYWRRSIYERPGLLSSHATPPQGHDHEWGGWISLCQKCDLEDAYHLMFQLGVVAFRNNVDMTALRVIVAFFLLDDLRSLSLPPYRSFTEFKVNEKPTFDTLFNVVRPFCETYSDPSEEEKKNTRPRSSEEIRRIEAAKRELDLKCANECRKFSNFLLDQWPCAEPTVDGFSKSYLDLSLAMKEVMPEWFRMYKNLRLCHHIEEVQTVLDRHSAVTNIVVTPSIYPKLLLFERPRLHYSIPRLGNELLQKPGPQPNTHHDVRTVKLWGKAQMTTPSPALTSDRRLHITPEVTELEKLVSDAMESHCPVKLSYGQDLKESIDALKLVELTDERELNMHVSWDVATDIFNYEIREARTVVDQYFSQIRESLSFKEARFRWLHQSNLWPCMTPVSILQQLRSTSRCSFGPKMKDAIILYGLAVATLQRLNRMKTAFGKGDEELLRQEYKNQGHTNWRPSDYPDWLLLEIDANIQIREDQVEVAQEMISPSSGYNSILQMNMGQGKTSVIMAMVASVLANGTMLTRLLVPKALLSQTAQILQSRLGGLLDREITHIPFSRRTPTNPPQIREYHDLHEDMLHRSGIILGVPEHVLSFRLSGLQRLSDGKYAQATGMVRVQRWLDKICRDVLDECDYTLAVKTQLVYPSRSQLMVDGHPSRWEVTMRVLNLVARHLPDLAREFPRSLDLIERTPTGFPVVYFLRKDVEVALAQRIIEDITYGQMSILPMWESTDEQRDAVRCFISQERVNSSVSELAFTLFTDAPQAQKNLYLLRGLLAHGILLLCLKKRWKVQYGLHPDRAPMAVPFHAKGVPSDHAEWGHPDVANLFTCLSFYHRGLTEHQFRQSLQEILRSDDPAIEYDRWTQASFTLPETLRHWNTINVDDRGQVSEIWRHLRLKTVVINHFLRSSVFPVHAKQFSNKLQASGWDLPLHTASLGQSAAAKSLQSGITTGFSGTNDNRRLLPLLIKQQNLPGLSHTNAEVLTYLLQKRNRAYKIAAHPNGTRYSELDLLKYLKLRKMRILMDAGAFILELSNQALARAWLQEDDQAQAAVYFRKDNQPWVEYRAGKAAPLLSTPFAENMENCVVYIDEAHTRGTDLKLPPKAQGALTLGLNQTKDHRVQAAMRLRQLGTTQSIMFVSPPEVHQSILDVRQKSVHDSIASSDVLFWLINQTCNNNRELQPLYLSQGVDFCHRMQASIDNRNFLTNPQHRKSYTERLKRSDQQTLEQLYRPQSQEHGDMMSLSTAATASFTGRLTSFIEQLRQIYEKSHAKGFLKNAALEEVEQEREVTFEIEQEREIQRPLIMEAHYYSGLHDSIRNFVITGRLKGNEGYMEAAAVLELTDLGRKHGIDASMLLRSLYISTEFTRTRPVNWLLWNSQRKVGLVIIPEEAEEIIPIIRTMQSSDVHLIVYAAPFTKRMLQFDRLDYYALPSLPKGWSPPSWLPFELGILAGRLYFHFSDYEFLLEQLRLDSEKPITNVNPAGAGTSAACDNSFFRSQLNFLQDWLTLRRQGQDISHTPMGYVCQGSRLRPDHPFFLARKAVKEIEDTDRRLFYTTNYRDNDKLEEYYDSDDDDDPIPKHNDNLKSKSTNNKVQCLDDEYLLKCIETIYGKTAVILPQPENHRYRYSRVNDIGGRNTHIATTSTRSDGCSLHQKDKASIVVVECKDLITSSRIRL
ncbi:hypothetical protein BDV30DRAFT_228123 [Aspergillus minisclerotigenes]|uniref:ubiquitinyl hydrolase 1 n=1 Tax=Aspergillus minisclerotigenes TaxID=656917 RepID=A0A5N6IXW9_9EURO|nr:hypothetical protein BDV30DRAFT_228123 [Aspergillus minisclerotigenes]